MHLPWRHGLSLDSRARGPKKKWEMTDQSLDVVMTPERLSATELAWNVPAGWEQGRGAFGGIVVGALIRAVEAVENDAVRQVRSVTAELVGPVQPGAARIEVEVLRRGNAVSTLRAWLTQADQLLAHAVVVLGAARAGTPSWTPQQVEIPEPPAPAIMPPGIAPVFAQHFEYRPTGPAPFTAHARAEAAGFVHPRAAASRLDAAYVAAHADAYWLAAMATFDRPRPAATVAFTLHLQALPEAADGPLYHRATSSSCVDGYSSETRELFTRTGKLLSVNHQIIAIIK